MNGLNQDYFEVDNKYEKNYPVDCNRGVFESLKKYLGQEKLDLFEHSFIMCCSEYGISEDDEALVFHIQKNNICFTKIIDIVAKFVEGSNSEVVTYNIKVLTEEE